MGSMSFLAIAQKNNYTLVVYITFSTGVHVPKSHLHCMCDGCGTDSWLGPLNSVVSSERAELIIFAMGYC